MRPFETNPEFTNPLVKSSSPYLLQHAHNPVFWYPWGREAIERARTENKPILLSIGYSSCYWCHVMEREVFTNLSAAALMNRHFINIKVDREERPDLDEIYMVARQIMSKAGGWPNTLFLTPDLKPFYAGGSYLMTDQENIKVPAWPRLLEWLNYSWTTQEQDLREQADEIHRVMKVYLSFERPDETLGKNSNIPAMALELFGVIGKMHDSMAGGFGGTPKFPHETYLSYLLALYEHTNENEAIFTQNSEALDMVVKSLRKMAAGGFHDHVGCGFHRYAVDKEWYIPHFEKMLYTQAMMARVYTDAARFTGNAYFADMAKSTLDMVSGPFTDAGGAFYSSFDAEVDKTEGAYYVWTPEELERILSFDENGFFNTFYSFADIPVFPGHQDTNGFALIARKPLDEAAKERNVSYLQLSAMVGTVMNKLLAIRNARPSPARDEKIIVGWNGLMIDAYAHAGVVLKLPNYLFNARKAADFILEHAISNEGALCRIYASGKIQPIPATLEDYAYLMKGLLTLVRATPDDTLMQAIYGLVENSEKLFLAENGCSYLNSQKSDYLLMRPVNCEDMIMPNANAVMVHNMIDLYEITSEEAYLERAKAISNYFLHPATNIVPELATMMHAALRIDSIKNRIVLDKPQVFDLTTKAKTPDSIADDVVKAAIELVPADAAPGDEADLVITLQIKSGWHINAHEVNHSFLKPIVIEIQGAGAESEQIDYPEPFQIMTPGEDLPVLTFSGTLTVVGRLKILGEPEEERKQIKARVTFQPCNMHSCYREQTVILTAETPTRLAALAGKS